MLRAVLSVLGSNKGPLYVHFACGCTVCCSYCCTWGFHISCANLWHCISLLGSCDLCLHSRFLPVCNAGLAASVGLAETVYGVSANVILDSACRAITSWDIVTSCIKSWVFGTIIAVVSTKALVHAGLFCACANALLHNADVFALHVFAWSVSCIYTVVGQLPGQSQILVNSNLLAFPAGKLQLGFHNNWRRQGRWRIHNKCSCHQFGSHLYCRLHSLLPLLSRPGGRP